MQRRHGNDWMVVCACRGAWTDWMGNYRNDGGVIWRSMIMVGLRFPIRHGLAGIA